MNIFWNLVSFEYKKIFKRKGAVITLILAAAVSLFSVFGTIIGYVYDSNGEPLMSRYDDLKTDLEYARKLSGRVIDTELITEAVHEYQMLDTNDIYYAFSENYRKYYAVFDIAH